MRNVCLEPQGFAADGMHKAQNLCMQRLSWKCAHNLCSSIADRTQCQLAPPAIGRIAHQRMARMGQMHTDLMRAPVSSQHSTRLATCGAPNASTIRARVTAWRPP